MFLGCISLRVMGVFIGLEKVLGEKVVECMEYLRWSEVGRGELVWFNLVVIEIRGRLREVVVIVSVGFSYFLFYRRIIL